jgi:hypothetical protein
MELQNFITETLKQIIEGVQGAQKYITTQNIEATIHPQKSREKIETVEFDVAVTSIESNQSGVSGGIKVASIFAINGEGGNLSSEQNISRIKFKVQIELPHQDNDNLKVQPTATGENLPSKNSF